MNYCANDVNPIGNEESSRIIIAFSFLNLAGQIPIATSRIGIFVFVNNMTNYKKHDSIIHKGQRGSYSTTTLHGATMVYQDLGIEVGK